MDLLVFIVKRGNSQLSLCLLFVVWRREMGVDGFVTPKSPDMGGWAYPLLCGRTCVAPGSTREHLHARMWTVLGCVTGAGFSPGTLAGGGILSVCVCLSVGLLSLPLSLPLPNPLSYARTPPPTHACTCTYTYTYTPFLSSLLLHVLQLTTHFFTIRITGW